MNNKYLILSFLVLFISLSKETMCQGNSTTKLKIVKDKSQEESLENTSDDIQNSMHWGGIYKGILPCSDCEGVMKELELKYDSTYKMKTEYLGKSEQLTINECGSFSWNNQKHRIKLISNTKKDTTDFLVERNKLVLLNLDGEVNTGPLAKYYILKQIETFSIKKNDHMQKDLDQAIKLRSQKKYDESERIFKKLVKEYPDNAQIYYHYAWLCDNLEREPEARPKYEKALELGLCEEDRKGCYLGLGSTYRCIGEYEKSIALFNKAIKEFPHNNEFNVFKAMALYNTERHKEAMNLLLNVIASTSSDKGVIEYKRAIEYYSDKLDKKFD